MLLTSVILVLREVLEAALLISLLMAMSQRMGQTSRWVGAALATGLLAAAVYGFNIDLVSDWFDGVGQEVINAALQILIYGLLCAVAVAAVRHDKDTLRPNSRLPLLMALPVTLAIVREGAEIMIYLSGFMQLPGQRTSVIAGSAIGAGIGLSVGAVFYFTLLNLKESHAKLAGGCLLALVAAGMIAQARQLLIQADWLPTQYPLWDSSWLIDEQSVVGQLLYALIGYEATPTPLQMGAYVASIALLIIVALILSRDADERHA